MTKYLGIFSFVVILVSCGGGGSSSSGSPSSGGSTLTGSLTDAPVQGVSYTASPSGLSGTTALDGSFQYKSGDSVLFKVFNIPLGNAVPVPSNGIVTPVTITNEVSATTTATSTNAPNATAIAQFLQTLSLASNSTSISGTLVMPTGSTASSVQTALTNLSITSSTPISTIVGNLQSALNTALGTSVVTVVPAASAIAQVNTANQSAISAAANSGDANTVWNFTCEGGCGGATVVLLGNGTIAGVTQDGNPIYGTWIVSGGAITFNAGDTKGGYASGTLPAGRTSCTGCLTLVQTGQANRLLDVTEISGSAATTNAGLWYFNFTPNSTGIADGDTSTLGLIIAGPDGSITGAVSTGSTISGTWSGNTFTAQSSGNNVVTINGSFSTLSGTATLGGSAIGTFSLSRIPPPLTTVSAPITINWANTFRGAGGTPPGGCGDCNPGIIISVSNSSNTASFKQQYTNPYNNGNGGLAGQGHPTTLSSTLVGTFVPPGTYSYTVSIDSSGGNSTSEPASLACSVSAGASGTFTTSSTQSSATLGSITVTCSN